MTYQQTLEYLFAQLPMFQRQGAAAFKKDLSNTIALCDALDNPHQAFRSIHVAGTNGKGSVSHFLASILQATGYRVGLYTSPHLKDFRERIRVNGKMIEEADVVNFTAANRVHFDRIRPSFFEMTVAMAFHHFRAENVDIAVIETGMGGRLDSTNVITPILSVITNIGHDHQQFLGDTLPEIAGEKAGIIKQHVPVVIGERQEETTCVFEAVAKQKNAPIQFASDVYSLYRSSVERGYDMRLSLAYRGEQSDALVNVVSGLSGPHQHKNVRTVLSAVDALRHSGITISEEALNAGLLEVVERTGLMGRWQRLSEQPLTLCDTAHNKEGIAPIMERLNALSAGKQLHIVWGMVNDKDHGSILSILPKTARYYFCRPDIPRGLDAEHLAEKAATFGLMGQPYSTVQEATSSARQAAADDAVIFIGGSTFVVAEVV